MRNLLIGVVTVVLLMGSAVIMAKDAAPQESNDEVVAYLYDYVAKSGCVFIRNGEEYDGKQAAAHIKSKNDYYKGKIKTPEDFIRLAATKSMMSGKPYMIRTKDGQQLRCDDWMKKALEARRKAGKSEKLAPNNG